MSSEVTNAAPTKRSPRRAYCLSEDRPGADTGLRLLVLSLNRHDPGTPIFLYRSNCTASFKRWLKGVPAMHLLEYAPEGGFDSNCKPQAMLPLLDQGFEEVVWLDSDILVNGPLGSLLDRVPAQELVMAQDSPASVVGAYTLASRTLAWGWTPTRELGMTLNTCILRITSHHVPLMQRWRELLESDRYRAQAALPLHQRVVGFISDQEVLTAILGSAEFAAVPLRVLRTGSEVVHSAGPLSFSLGDRWRWCLRGPPVALHATTGKPWNILRTGFARDRRARLTQLAQELAPYVAAARRYAPDLEAEERDWLEFRTPAGTLLKMIGLGQAPLVGLPLTVLAQILKRFSKA